MVKEHSDIQVMARTSSLVCCKKTSNACSLDPDDCKVGIMGGGDTWARSCGECPQPCMTDYNICSRLSPKTCLDASHLINRIDLPTHSVLDAEKHSFEETEGYGLKSCRPRNVHGSVGSGPCRDLQQVERGLCRDPRPYRKPIPAVPARHPLIGN